MLRPTLYAVPIFALLIAAEAWLSMRRGSDAYVDKKDAWVNIFLGFMSLAFGALLGLFTAIIYIGAYEFAPYKFPIDAWWSWVILFFVDDLAY